jgi:hypothetical protein
MARLPAPTWPAWPHGKPTGTQPPLSSPRVWVPTLTVSQELSSPIGNGCVRLVVVPSPNSPEAFRPQHHNVPSVRIPQV